MKNEKPHIEIENMDSCKQAHLICNGWFHNEDDDTWSCENSTARGLCLDDALKLQSIFEGWGNEKTD
jgi:hypothetical protein